VATIVYSSYVIRYPVGGILSSNLQFLRGFARLGHEVVLVESNGWPNACFDPARRTLGDDPSAGIRSFTSAVAAQDLPVRWAFVDQEGRTHGLDRAELDAVFARADLFIDRGLHRTFLEESADVPVRVLVDPDPGYRQIQMELARGGEGNSDGAEFDAYYTYGQNIGTSRSSAPTGGVEWRHLFHPVDVTGVVADNPPPGAPFTTVMNWRSLDELAYDGHSYGMKDKEFPRFADLPSRVAGSFEIAVEGDAHVPDELRAQGWIASDAVDATRDLAAFQSFVSRSCGEFSVLKEVYVALDVGWFSDRSAMYLARGRPVVVQDNGLDGHLPLGEGLFSVSDVDKAAAAVESIRRDPERHRLAARRIAEEYLDTNIVLGRFLTELGLPPKGKP
jgi:hypothetical protein